MIDIDGRDAGGFGKNSTVVQNRNSQQQLPGQSLVNYLSLLSTFAIDNKLSFLRRLKLGTTLITQVLEAFGGSGPSGALGLGIAPSGPQSAIMYTPGDPTSMARLAKILGPVLLTTWTAYLGHSNILTCLAASSSAEGVIATI